MVFRVMFWTSLEGEFTNSVGGTKRINQGTLNLVASAMSTAGMVKQILIPSLAPTPVKVNS